MKFFSFVSLLVVFASASTLAQTSPVPSINRPLVQQTLGLAGPGISLGTQFRLRPSRLSFNERGEQQVTLTNLGSSALNVSITITGSDAFSQTNTCASVEARKSCAIMVTFWTYKIGNFTGELLVTGNGASHESVSLWGHFGP